MEPPVCFLCKKFLDGPYREDSYVRFADYRSALTEREAAFGSAYDDKLFCDDHLAAAKALSSLAAPEALIELQKEYGVFEWPKPKKLKWWREWLIVLRQFIP